ncbi:putative drug exporter of the RND superfamily [Thermomonospora echinospora]|uniref:Putative drug exporter of the RND superfamily n=1 Tax=Thermomonospora echinospora TaxID=1992 RepID=A0A1H6DKD4_9ACTN|nr:MMPL family transporter [Thermomonospora echinospora]SEG85897.1 putative drug exporter of the RND superfamily [Thermomonospora echinospora]
MARALEGLGRWCVRRRRTVFELWIAAILGIGFLGLTQGGVFVQQSSLPGTETQRAVDALGQDFPAMTGPTTTVVFAARPGPGAAAPGDWRVALGVGEAIENIGRLDRVGYVENPYVQGMGGLKSDRAVVVRVFLKGTMGDVGAADLARLDQAVEPARMAGLDVEFGGIVSMLLNQPHGGPGEAAGLIMALLVLLLAFGSYLAACVPILVSLCALAVAYSLIHFGASVLEIHPLAPMVAAMLGLGAGIDYALFIVTRYRQQLAEGDDVETAVGRAMAHSGHAVVFAGGTVVFAICGLFLSGITFVGRIGIASALTVALMVVAALTLLPAVLGAIGTRIDRYTLPRVRPDRSGDRWARWGRHVDRHAWPYAIGATLVLLVFALPTLDLRFGVMADSTSAPSMSARQAYDTVAEEFGAGHYSPWVVVARVPGSPAGSGSGSESGSEDRVPAVEGPAGLTGLTAPQAPPAATAAPGGGPDAAAPPVKGAPDPAKKPNRDAVLLGQELKQAVTEVPGVAFVGDPVVAGDTAILTVIPRTAPHVQATTDLVHRLRATELPAVAAAHPGAEVYLGGENPAIIDLADTVGGRMPVVVVAVVIVALLLLVVAFRAIMVPVKAALMNLLSIGASYGVVTAVFQWGWGIQLFGADQAVPIVSFIPLFMFALIFGLSMDYEVFLLSRIKEEYDRTGDPHGSVVTGIGATARLITSAALIMIFVFVSFVPQPDPTVKMMALGLAVAVAVDATIVRLVLVPALMSLLGHANWWFPGGSRRAASPPQDAGPGKVSLVKEPRSLEPVG